MLLRDFIAKLQEIEDECRGTHHFNGDVEVFFFVECGDDIGDVELDRVEPWVAPGCGCWIGANVTLKSEVERA